MFWTVHTVLYSSLKFSGLNFRQSLGLETNYKFFGYGQSCLSDCKQFEINVRTRCTSRNSGFSKSTCRDQRRFTPRGSLLEVHSLRFTPRGSLPEFHSQRFTPRGSLPEVHSHRFTPGGSLPEVRSQRFTPKGSLPEVHSQRFTPRGSLPEV